MSDSILFEPIVVGDWLLPNRVLMAPLTRSRAQQPGDIPWELNAQYYAQRATSGLIISEATQISQQGKGYAFTPGIYTDEQVAGWKLVNDRVHAAGGRIVCQMWHVGRISHVALQPNGDKPVSSSSKRAESKTYIDSDREMVDVSEPRALETSELPGIVDQYRHAAECCKAAGFDGVEIHGANGYLLDQFVRDGVNDRTDSYGGSIENRCRLALEVARAVVGVWGAGRVGYRISPHSEYGDLKDSDPAAAFGHLAHGLGSMGLAYLHFVEGSGIRTDDPRDERSEAGDAVIRERFRSGANEAGTAGVCIGNNAYTPELAAQRVADGLYDAVAFGKLFISNPDLPERIRRDGPYREPNRETFYGGGAEGYSDQPQVDGHVLS
mgnify:CR=1 FL=1